MLNDRLVYLHDKILKVDKILEKYPNNKKSQKLKQYKKELIERFSNLSKVIIGAALKKYKTFADKYNDLYVECLTEVLDSLFKKKKYDKNKSLLSSYIFEISR